MSCSERMHRKLQSLTWGYVLRDRRRQVFLDLLERHRDTKNIEIHWPGGGVSTRCLPVCVVRGLIQLKAIAHSSFCLIKKETFLEMITFESDTQKTWDSFFLFIFFSLSCHSIFFFSLVRDSFSFCFYFDGNIILVFSLVWVAYSCNCFRFGWTTPKKKRKKNETLGWKRKSQTVVNKRFVPQWERRRVEKNRTGDPENSFFSFSRTPHTHTRRERGCGGGFSRPRRRGPSGSYPEKVKRKKIYGRCNARNGGTHAFISFKRFTSSTIQ